MAEPRTRVAVVFGGRRGEHEGSCKSALSVVRFLDRSRYEVVPVRIAPSGTWVFGKDAGSPEELDLEGLLALTRETDTKETDGKETDRKETDGRALASLAEAIGTMRE